MEQEAGFRRLRTWQGTHKLASLVFQTLQRDRTVPEWLKSQACRAALSVPANIAEGYSRSSPREYVRFLHIARGSLAELEYYVQFLQDNQLITDESAHSLGVLVTETATLLGALIKAVAAKHADGSWNRQFAID